RRRVHPPRQNSLVPPDTLTQGLVAGADSYYGDQRDDQAERGGNVPLAEDDAQVGRIPGEEHLLKGEQWSFSLWYKIQSTDIHFAHGPSIATAHVIVAGVG